MKKGKNIEKTAKMTEKNKTKKTPVPTGETAKRYLYLRSHPDWLDKDTVDFAEELGYKDANSFANTIFKYLREKKGMSQEDYLPVKLTRNVKTATHETALTEEGEQKKDITEGILEPDRTKDQQAVSAAEELQETKEVKLPEHLANKFKDLYAQLEAAKAIINSMTEATKEGTKYGTQ